MLSALRFNRPQTRLLVLLAAVVCLSACSSDEADPNKPSIEHPQDFLPPATSNMTTTGDPVVATDASSLTAIINGGYTEYMNHGFQEMARQNYSGNVGGAACSVTADIYDLGNSVNTTYMLENKTEVGNWQPVANTGDEALEMVGFGTTQFFIRDGKFYIEMIITSTDADAQTLLRSWGTHIVQEIGN